MLSPEFYPYLTDRQYLITHYRRSQSLAELERKWNKARGRHSNQSWTDEWLDLASKRADLLSSGLRLE